jgi:hypothetical protein
MISLAQRILHAIDNFERGEFEFALEDAAVAIDVTAQRHFGSSKSNRHQYKLLLDKYFWLIELMALNGINVQESTFEHINIRGIAQPRLPDLIYHIVRCGLVHSTGLPSTLQFAEGRTLFFTKDLTVLPAQVLWGLVAIAVFAKVNSTEQSEGEYYLSYKGQRFLIKDHWGREDLIRPVYDRHVQVRVALKITPFA